MKLQFVAIGILCAAAYAPAQSKNLKVVEQNGHLSPVAIRITTLNGQTRDLMLIGIGSPIRSEYLTHQLTVRTDGGASDRTLWLDSIAAIRATSTLRRLNDEFTIVLKSGKQFAASFAGWHDTSGCHGEPSDESWVCNVIFVRNEDDGIEKMDFRKVQAIEFIGPVRKDKANNAMYDHWRYSPYTGEKLP